MKDAAVIITDSCIFTTEYHYIPSGWSVDCGSPPSWSPHALVSLTAPKLCAREFKGRHWLGGRFVPPSMAATLQLHLPQYCGADPVVLLHGTL